MTAGRLIRIGLVVAGIWVALFLVGYWIFNSGGSEPGSGDGDPVQVVTTP
jgi:hypothetical protein